MNLKEIHRLFITTNINNLGLNTKTPGSNSFLHRLSSWLTYIYHVLQRHLKVLLIELPGLSQCIS